MSTLKPPCTAVPLQVKSMVGISLGLGVGVGVEVGVGVGSGVGVGVGVGVGSGVGVGVGSVVSARVMQGKIESANRAMSMSDALRGFIVEPQSMSGEMAL